MPKFDDVTNRFCSSGGGVTRRAEVCLFQWRGVSRRAEVHEWRGVSRREEEASFFEWRGASRREEEASFFKWRGAKVWRRRVLLTVTGHTDGIECESDDDTGGKGAVCV